MRCCSCTVRPSVPASARRTRDVQQQQHRQIASPPQAIQIDRLVGHRSRQQFDVCLDRRIDVDVVALRLTVPAVQAHSEPRQRTPHADGIVDRRARRSLCRRLDFEHRAPIRPIALAVEIPFRILHPAGSQVGNVIDDVLTRRGRQRRHRVRTAFAELVRCVGVSAPGGPPPLSGLARRGQHLLQPLADEAAAADRAGEQVGIVAVVVDLVRRRDPSTLGIVGVAGRVPASAARSVSPHAR